jgi:metal-responsive CopG/Arc/MetJ family transcriptional regulator
MDVAVSIPDPVFAAAEDAATRLAVSRSELYTKAIESFLRTCSKPTITDQINRVCEKVDTSMDPVLLEMSLRSIEPENW